MQDQLHRIKTTNYANFDQKILENIQTDHIGSTLSHLSQIQNFLIQQIGSLQKNRHSPKTQDNSILEISKHCQTLKQSILKCSVVPPKKEAKNWKKINQKIVNLRKEHVMIKAEVSLHLKNIQKWCLAECEKIITPFVESNKNLKEQLERAKNIISSLRKQSEHSNIKLTQKSIKTSPQKRASLANLDQNISVDKFCSKNIELMKISTQFPISIKQNNRNSLENSAVNKYFSHQSESFRRDDQYQQTENQQVKRERSSSNIIQRITGSTASPVEVRKDVSNAKLEMRRDYSLATKQKQNEFSQKHKNGQMDSTEKDSNMLLRMKGVCEKIPYVKNKKGVKQKIKLVSLLA